MFEGRNSHVYSFAVYYDPVIKGSWEIGVSVGEICLALGWVSHISVTLAWVWAHISVFKRIIWIVWKLHDQWAMKDVDLALNKSGNTCGTFTLEDVWRGRPLARHCWFNEHLDGRPSEIALTPTRLNGPPQLCYWMTLTPHDWPSWEHFSRLEIWVTRMRIHLIACLISAFQFHFLASIDVTITQYKHNYLEFICVPDSEFFWLEWMSTVFFSACLVDLKFVSWQYLLKQAAWRWIKRPMNQMNSRKNVVTYEAIDRPSARA